MSDEIEVSKSVAVTGNAKPKNKKKKTLAPAQNDLGCIDNSRFRLLGDWPAIQGARQTLPPTIPIDKCYQKGKFPIGQIIDYEMQLKNGTERKTDSDCKKRDIEIEPNLDQLRRAAEAHRQVRRDIQCWLKPGMTLWDIAVRIDAKIKELIRANGLESGHAFPTGLSINECAAHYTPNPGETERVLLADDIMKVDYGIHVGGRLIDCAFTVAFNEKYDPLIKATQDATNMGLKMAGPDQLLGEIGAAAEEIIRSYEVELDGKIVAVKPIENLSGHTTDVYRVHAGKSVPIVKSYDNERMEEGELYAIETFASTGRGRVQSEGPCSHYMLDYEWQNSPQRGPLPRMASAHPVLRTIQHNFSTLAFCRRWLDELGCTKHSLGLKALENAGIVNPYPPLCDIQGSFTSQMEHSVYLRPTCKEVLSRGDDY